MALLSCLVFYVAYREWLSGLLLTAVFLTPLFSLILSLPAVLTCRVSMQCPPRIIQGGGAMVGYSAKCRFPIPPLKGKVEVLRVFTGKKEKLRFGNHLQAPHCGAVILQRGRVRMYDYLGLFCFRLARMEPQTVLVHPIAQKPEVLPDLTRYLSFASRPKPGGGYSENHELRLYRPGDSLRQIHWKLSAKTGKLILREPMEPVKGSALVTLVLSGTPEELDLKLGQLLYVSCWLTEQQVPHRVCCLTDNGMQLLSVNHETDAIAAVDTLLRCPPLQENLEPSWPASSWRCHIGGDSHG